jgi:small subunit ribosomal protein S18
MEGTSNFKPKTKRFGKGRGKDYIFATRENILYKLKIKKVDWKDTELLKKFISDRGKIRPRDITGLTVKQQRQVAKAIKNAREMALLPFIAKR